MSQFNNEISSKLVESEEEAEHHKSLDLHHQSRYISVNLFIFFELHLWLKIANEVVNEAIFFQ